MEKQAKSAEETGTGMDCIHPSRLARMGESSTGNETRSRPGGAHGSGGKRGGWQSRRSD